MLETSRRMLLIVCSLSMVGIGTGIAGVAPVAGATEELRAEEIRLQRIDAKGAVTILRVISGIREIEIVDGQTVRIRSSPEKLLLARKILELAEESEAGEPEVVKYEVGDGTHVAAVALRHAAGREPMVALRTLGIARFAYIDSPPIVIVRDTEEQIRAALQLILAKDRTPP